MAPVALVVNPWVSDFKLYDEWMHPLGLYALASLLRHNGWRVRLFDCLAEGRVKSRAYGTGDFAWRPLPKPPLYREIPRRYKRYGCDTESLASLVRRERAPDLACVGSGMTYWSAGLVETVQSIRELLPRVPMTVGGPGATLAAGWLRSQCPDITVHEGPLLGGDSPVALASGVSLNRAGWTFSLLDAMELLPAAAHGPVLTGLGCPFRCTYCASSLLQPAVVHRDPTLVFEEVAWLCRRRGVTDFAFYDDALLWEPETTLLPFLEKVRSAGLRVRFHTPNGLHARYAVPGVLGAMAGAGFTTLRFGFESASTLLAEHTAGKAGRQELSDAVRAALEAGFHSRQVGVYVMGGLPGQTVADMLNDMRFVGSLGALVKPVFLSPIPGAPLFRTLVAQWPDLISDPASHNDTFFASRLDGWGWDAMETIRIEARRLNALVR